MRDEVLTAATPLVGVTLAGEGEGVLHGLAVDLIVSARVLGDYSEQIPEKRAILLRELLRVFVDRRRRSPFAVPLADAQVAAAVGRSRSIRAVALLRRTVRARLLGRAVGGGLLRSRLRRGCALAGRLCLRALGAGALYLACLRPFRNRLPSSQRALYAL
jgi:hypothetical protein